MIIPSWWSLKELQLSQTPSSSIVSSFKCPSLRLVLNLVESEELKKKKKNKRNEKERKGKEERKKEERRGEERRGEEGKK